MPEPVPRGRVVTFYSYKGGTGRSMAMANVAWVLALSGFTVLAIDWDLEAPGLHRYFRPFLDDPELSQSDGLIDFVIHFTEVASAQPEQQEDDWYKPHANLLRYAQEVKYDFPGGGALDLIPAGRQTSAYALRVNSFNWDHFYTKLNGGRLLDEAREILKEEYDYILIDSRTGVSDTSGICTVQMPDDLVVCFTLNLQSVMGASAVAASVIEQRTRRGSPIRVFPVPMRVDPFEQTKLSVMKAFAKPRFVALLPAEWSDEQRDKYWAESDVPYIPFYAYEENLTYFRDEPNNPKTVLYTMTLLAGRLTPSGIGELPRPDPEVLAKMIAAYDAFWGPSAPIASEAPPTSVYLSAETDAAGAALRADLVRSGCDLLTRARFEKAKSAVFLIAIGTGGFTAQQREELALAERVRIGPIYTVLLQGAQPESLPRLLLPYEVIDLRGGGRLSLPLAPGGLNLTRLALSPWPGLNPFTSNDGPFFFARGPLVDRLTAAVNRSKFVALIGPRHSGRMSLVQAGLIPRLKVRQLWFLGGEMEAAGTEPVWEVHFSWPVPARPWIRTPPPGVSGRQLVVSNPSAVLACDVTTVPEGTCLLVISEPSLVEACELKLQTTAERIEIRPLSDAELMAAITEPAVRAGLQVEEGLANRIVADLKSEPAQLPLLQYIMSELYAAEPRGVLTAGKYESLGGARIVEVKCERLAAGGGLGSLSRLILLDEDGTMSPQAAPEASMNAGDPVVNALVSAGVLVREENSVSFASSIFLHHWPRLRQFISDNREFLLWRQRFDQTVAAWQVGHRPVMLLRGAALAEARNRAENRSADLNAEEHAYIEASERFEEETDANQQRTAATLKTGRRWQATGVALAVIAGLSLIGYRITKSPETSSNQPTQGWCFQLESPGLQYRGFCYAAESECLSVSAKRTGSAQCNFVPNLRQAWGDTPQGAAVAQNGWSKSSSSPLPSPFPPPRSER